jgi:hypothetical protein
MIKKPQKGVPAETRRVLDEKKKLKLEEIKEQDHLAFLNNRRIKK